jgi:hypothetical protein
MPASNWQVHFRNHPDVFLAAAASAGLIAGILTAGKGGEPRRQRVRGTSGVASSFASGVDMPAAAPSRPWRDRGPKARELAQTWDHVTEALIGVGIAKMIDLVAHYVPGFREHYESRSAPSRLHPEPQRRDH